ncbi:hypothetical protein [Nostoc sp.]|uniref:hypothetical protein n=1 Tax=Nostoc sp. TaxID=1180 RepID=UPI002FF444B1
MRIGVLISSVGIGNGTREMRRQPPSLSQLRAHQAHKVNSVSSVETAVKTG